MDYWGVDALWEKITEDMHLGIALLMPFLFLFLCFLVVMGQAAFPWNIPPCLRPKLSQTEIYKAQSSTF